MKLDTKDYEAKMAKAVASYQENLSSIRAGQANSAVLNKVTFEYWGTPTPIKDMADIRVADAKTLTVSPYDATTLKEMEKAILASDIGITPTNDGKVIRLIFPQPTEERRKELVKQVQKFGEDAKVAIRNIRRDANDTCKKMKKDGEMTEDEQKASEKSVQDLTDKFIKEIDAVTAKKESEIMKI
ncbi:MAG: ribosome recycling factor [Clostridia bacterium]|nr:ribosome recycling factor [Clostridia bacterium]MBR4013384.1 ribosome recycling factor [Clostridia bacterium]